MASFLYTSFTKKIADGSIDLDTDTIRMMLVSNSYTPNQDTHEFQDDVTGELSGSGYTAGGKTLANKTLTTFPNFNSTTFDADNVVWTALTLTGIKAGILYKDTGDDETSPLIAYIDLGTPFNSTGGTLTIAWNDGGIITFTLAS